LPRSYLKEARRRVGPKKDRIGPIIERLAAEHADAAIALRFRSPLELLVSVMLSAQTTDVNVNRVTQTLFEKYRRPEDYLAVPQSELERDVFATGFYRQKAKALRGTMQVLLEDFVRRLSQRLGFTRQEDPVKIERDLVRLVPRADWDRFPHLLIWHGRRVCDARRPRCEDCVVNDLCPSSRV
jgi:endonuclease-3